MLVRVHSIISKFFTFNYQAVIKNYGVVYEKKKNVQNRPRIINARVKREVIGSKFTSAYRALISRLRVTRYIVITFLKKRALFKKLREPRVAIKRNSE